MAPDIYPLFCQERGKQNLLRFGVIMGWISFWRVQMRRRAAGCKEQFSQPAGAAAVAGPPLVGRLWRAKRLREIRASFFRLGA